MYVSMTFQLLIMTTIGLMLGSFLNVVIHRLPAMIMWDGSEPHRGTLAAPRSHCPSCHTQLKWYHNIPVLSYALLRGRCAYCQSAISARYPTVEVLTAVIWFISGLGFRHHQITFNSSPRGPLWC